jgi:hypothetical protein
VLKIACRSRSRVAMTLSPETVFCSDMMMLMSLGQSRTYRVLGCALGEGLPTKMAGGRYTLVHR